MSNLIETLDDVVEQIANWAGIYGACQHSATLEQLAITGLKRPVKQREAIDIGPCECGG